jgi:hypothetical protein
MFKSHCEDLSRQKNQFLGLFTSACFGSIQSLSLRKFAIGELCQIGLEIKEHALVRHCRFPFDDRGRIDAGPEGVSWPLQRLGKDPLG